MTEHAAYFLLLLAGAICFGFAAIGLPMRRINLIALGLLCWIAVPLIQSAQR